MILSENIRRIMWVMTRPEGRAPPRSGAKENKRLLDGRIRGSLNNRFKA
jgi:hypothetical protein